MEFRDLLGGHEPEEFFSGILDAQPLHQPGAFADGAEAFDGAALADLLNRQGLWDVRRLALVMGGRELAAEDYSVPDSFTGKLRPDGARITRLLGQGADLILREAEGLDPWLAGLRRALALGLGARVAIDLHLLQAGAQPAPLRFDVEERFVFVLDGSAHVHIHEGREPWPVDAAAWRVREADRPMRAGGLAGTVEAGQGDMIYLPRGQWHVLEAGSKPVLIASARAALPLGLDFLEMLLGQAMGDPEFRRALPREPEALASRLRQLAARLPAAIDDRLVRRVAQMMELQAQETTPIDLGVVGFAAPEISPRAGARAEAEPRRRARGRTRDKDSMARAPYVVTSSEFRIVRSADGRLGLRGPKGVVEMPARLEAPVAWVLDQGGLDPAALSTRFPSLKSDLFVEDLLAMGVVENARTSA